MAEEKKNYLMSIYDGLNNKLDAQVSALPKEFNKQRFVQNCMTVLQDTKNDFSKCEPATVVRTLMKGAFLGLDFFNGECYAIPYKETCSFQTDYKGEIKLCKKYSSVPIKDIYAKIVREGDFFEEYIENGQQTINFRPKQFNNGEIIGAFAVCLYRDGSMIYDTMSKTEIETTRDNYSKMATGQAWTKSYGEMCKKTVLRRLCKLIDLDFDYAEQMQAFEDASPFDVKHEEKPEPEKAVDVFANVGDVEESEVINVDEAREVFPD